MLSDQYMIHVWAMCQYEHRSHGPAFKQVLIGTCLCSIHCNPAYYYDYIERPLVHEFLHHQFTAVGLTSNRISCM